MNRFEQFNMREFEFITFFLWYARGSRSAAVEWQQALINGSMKLMKHFILQRSATANARMSPHELLIRVAPISGYRSR
jgi:hypothetical protein